MVNFLNLFIIFITLNYDVFLHNIKASNNNPLKKKTKDVFALEKIQEEKYEINGRVLSILPNFKYKAKQVKITELEYDGIEIQFLDKNYLPIDIKESEFHRIMYNNLKSNDYDYYFKIKVVVFKVTVFIEKKRFHTTLWYECLSNPVKISTSVHDQLSESFNRILSHSLYKYIFLPLDCFDNTTYSNSEYSENQNIYDVNSLRSGQKKYYLYNLTIDKDSKAYNVNYFGFDHGYLEVYTKIYHKTSDHGMTKGYIGKSINQCNMNEKVLFFCTKTNKAQDKNNNNIIQNENNSGDQSVQKNTLKIAKISCNPQTNEIKISNLDLISKCKYCQKNVESKETQINLDDVNTIVKSKKKEEK